MNLSEIEKIMSEHMRICPICSMPYDSKNPRQRTCGDAKCKRMYRNKYMKQYNERRMQTDPDAVRERNARAMRRYRQKQKDTISRDVELKELGERWQKQSDFDKKIAEYGVNYGQVSAQKVLEKVPKIDVSVKGESDDRVQSDDE